MPLSVNATVRLVASHTGATVPGITTPEAKVDKAYASLLASGTGAGQGDKFWTAQRTIAASANDDLDLNGGSLVDAFGVALGFVKIKGIIVSAAAANANNVIIGGASSTFASWVTGTNPAVVVRPGTTFALIAGQADASGYAVTATSADVLRITNGGAGSTVTYDIQIWGTSA